jgi:hypothetical protein
MRPLPETKPKKISSLRALAWQSQEAMEVLNFKIAASFSYEKLLRVTPNDDCCEEQK